MLQRVKDLDIFLQADLIRHKRQLFFIGFDGLIATLTSLVLTRFFVNLPDDRSIFYISSLVFIVIFVSFICGLYSLDILPFRSRLHRSGFALAIALVSVFILAGEDRGVFTLFAFGSIVFFAGQVFWQQIFAEVIKRGFLSRKVLVLGTGAKALKTARLIKKSDGHYLFAGYLGTSAEPVQVPQDQVIGQMSEIVELTRDNNIHAIVIAMAERRGCLAVDRLVICKLNGTRIIDYPTFVEMVSGKIPVEDINPGWLVQVDGFLITPFVRFVKRCIDIVLALTLLLTTIPLMCVIAVLIKRTSAGPVFYFQQRVGMHGRPFTIFKFRSMTVDAERQTGAQWASEKDPRVTPVGAFMRKTRIDELPQLVNVLKGEMSFIGPRPERPEFVEEIAKTVPYYHERHAVKPGITGWAQIRYPYGASIGDAFEKLRYDLYYVKNMSFFLEIVITIETVQVVLFRKGGR